MALAWQASSQPHSHRPTRLSGSAPWLLGAASTVLLRRSACWQRCASLTGCIRRASLPSAQCECAAAGLASLRGCAACVTEQGGEHQSRSASGRCRRAGRRTRSVCTPAGRAAGGARTARANAGTGIQDGRPSVEPSAEHSSVMRTGLGAVALYTPLKAGWVSALMYRFTRSSLRGRARGCGPARGVRETPRHALKTLLTNKSRR